jgi:hypothetical protein
MSHFALSVWTILNDGGQWIALVVLLADRVVARRRKSIFPIKIADLPYRQPHVFLSGREIDIDEDE